MRVFILVVTVSAIGSVFAQNTSTYSQQIDAICKTQNRLNAVYKGGVKIRQDKCVSASKAYIYTQLIDTIFPSWYGTEWDFNGYSNLPKKGQIACGYFVTTTLKHIGFNLNRYKLAQQYSHSIVNTLCNNVQFVRNNDTAKLFNYINNKKDQLYIVGLDNHVGFISKEKDGIYFIHSSYLDPIAVIKEKASQSEALLSSNLFVLGHFSDNDTIIKSWLTKTTISIKK
jgi:hypothetical protein